ncbi:hypothetical protein [Paenibacillus sp. FSL R7-0337]|uniref:hypothetical protein n=1 Tax=Paenibacillus sp. FSL R7-0337 TaxID=1926588 RepID=UPI0015C34BA9|nr:hypothetical protein [Paenibacillus sp. FSL R7-0337]
MVILRLAGPAGMKKNITQIGSSIPVCIRSTKDINEKQKEAEGKFGTVGAEATA